MISLSRYIFGDMVYKMWKFQNKFYVDVEFYVDVYYLQLIIGVKMF